MAGSVSIIMGSESDRVIATEASLLLEKHHISVDVNVISAHRNHDKLRDFIGKSNAKVFIAIVGGAAHLAGVIAAQTLRPVIGVPVKTDTMGGMDSLLSTVQMPKGMPVATVAINGGTNAAILAMQMLSISDHHIQNEVSFIRQEWNK